MNAGELVEVPRNPDFSLDMPAIRSAVLAKKPRIIFLASPNNPDGSMLPEEVFEELLGMPALLVLDEAYIEFSGSGRLGESASRIRRVAAGDNLVVLRTFSKWAGLAGLRLGYGAFPDWLMPVLWKAKQPYNVNVAASTAALASLSDLETLQANVASLLGERQRLYTALDGFTWLSPYPTRANFILCRVDGIDAAELKRRLAVEYGILVRYFSKPGLQDHIRISVGRPHETQALIAALECFDKEIEK
jgi:histidinol-phosphate aminotransferase